MYHLILSGITEEMINMNHTFLRSQFFLLVRNLHLLKLIIMIIQPMKFNQWWTYLIKTKWTIIQLHRLEYMGFCCKRRQNDKPLQLAISSIGHWYSRFSHLEGKPIKTEILSKLHSNLTQSTQIIWLSDQLHQSRTVTTLTKNSSYRPLLHQLWRVKIHLTYSWF